MSLFDTAARSPTIKSGIENKKVERPKEMKTAKGNRIASGSLEAPELDTVAEAVGGD